ncbi:MAG: M2 family metallopeptidase [Gemmatimonadota bacterium]
MEPFLTDLIDRLRPLEVETNRAWWDAAVTGDTATYARLETLRNAHDAMLRDPALFRRLAAARDAPQADPLVARAIALLYLEALPRQVDAELGEEMNRLSTAIEHAFSVYRPIVEGQPRTQNDLEQVLKQERDDARLRAAWEALKSVGPIVAPQLRQLVALRNTAARAVGYPDFYQLRLAMNEQDPVQLDAFLTRLDTLTAAPFAALKGELDAHLAERNGVAPEALAPWHYQGPFFQEMPAVFGADLDEWYADQDLLELARRFYAGIGLDVEEILARSSLYEADGKDPHAFATDIDREGDVRILLNLRPNERWMGTTLHELGHAVYDTGIDRELPWMLRRVAHTLTTEAIAMLFGRLSKSADWMAAMGIVDEAEVPALRSATERELRGQMLVFARWGLVMSHFERALYADPDQDLNRLWWDLKERIQGLTRPERPDGAAEYAAKIHIVVAPVYYHNYLLGECFASQIDTALRAEVLSGAETYCDQPAVGRWLRERIFHPGARLTWDALAEAATGSRVTPDAFAAQFLAPATV